MKKLKGRGTKAKTTEAEKVEFIREHFPKALKVNPYIDQDELLEDIRRGLIAGNFYQANKYMTYNIEQSRIIQLVLRAQGNKRTYRSGL
jgi:hypothetical protein